MFNNVFTPHSISTPSFNASNKNTTGGLNGNTFLGNIFNSVMGGIQSGSSGSQIAKSGLTTAVSLGSGAAAGAALGSVIPGIGTIIGGIVGSLASSRVSDFVDSGYTFNCLGSSVWKPSDMKKWIPEAVKKCMVNSGFSTTANAENFNKALLYLRVGSACKLWGHKCTHQSLELARKMFLKAYNELLSAGSPSFTKVEDKYYSVGEAQIPFEFDELGGGGYWTQNHEPITVPVFREKTFATAVSDALTPGSDYDPLTGGTYNNNNNNISSNNTLLYLGLGVLGYLVLKNKR